MSTKEVLSVKQLRCVEDTLKLALEALQSDDYWKHVEAVNAIKEALSAKHVAQPAVAEQHKQSTTCGEPENRCVRELREFAKSNQGAYIFPSWDGHRVLKYLGDTTPPQLKPLTDEQIEKIAKENNAWVLLRSLTIFDFARAIEAAHGIAKE